MMRRMLGILLLIGLAGCVWQPVVYDDSAQLSVEKAVAEFQQEAALEPFFEEALAYAVFPGSFRAGTGFGGAFGSGWLLESEAAVGRGYPVRVLRRRRLRRAGLPQHPVLQDRESLEQFQAWNFRVHRTGQCRTCGGRLLGCAVIPSRCRPVRSGEGRPVTRGQRRYPALRFLPAATGALNQRRWFSAKRIITSPIASVIKAPASTATCSPSPGG